ncbi:hypothetical protein CDD83_8224 [Cordyceps sp. RAO-2017]|nr:hypothetical protein CDD83_8224 [Cordyceps sp. RAO-2017]
MILAPWPFWISSWTDCSNAAAGGRRMLPLRLVRRLKRRDESRLAPRDRFVRPPDRRPSSLVLRAGRLCRRRLHLCPPPGFRDASEKPEASRVGTRRSSRRCPAGHETAASDDDSTTSLLPPAPQQQQHQQ